jgi:enoyl-CoA hydratase/carnithine racemase
MADLESRRDGDVLVLTLNRPEKRNALSLAMLEELEKQLEAAAMDDALRALVITGAGQKSFSSGMDLSVLFEHLASNPSGERIRKTQRRLQEMSARFEELEKPTIAAIEGACVGGGFELALSMDLRVASRESKFGFPEARIGMIPDLGGTTRLARAIGPARAKEWIFTGRQYDAERALALGLVNELAPPGEVLPRAIALAKELSGSGPLAIAWGKRVIDRGFGQSLQTGFELEQDAMTELLPSEDLKEGVMAFLEKRAPKFKGHRRG